MATLLVLCSLALAVLVSTTSSVQVFAPRFAVAARENPLATFGVTKFSDVSPASFTKTHRNSAAAIRLGRQLEREGKLPHLRWYTPTPREIPTAVDWRLRGAVTPVKNQGQCGSCWSFSTTGNIEGQWFLAGNTLTSFSEQNFVSCDNFFAFGCNGGFSWIAYSWVVDHQNGTIYTEASYPYVSANGTVPQCDTSRAVKGGSIIGGRLLSPWDPMSMKQFIAAEGPLSVAVDATDMWMDYVGGIVTNCTGALLPNHQVLIVGYNVTAGTPESPPLEYWIVKNSWGTDWGVDGYIFIEIGKDLCLIETLANSADVKA